VSRDIQRPIRLEVTVPSIVLPSLSDQAKPREADETQETVEQVHLLSLDPPVHRHSTPITQEIAQGEPSTHTTRTGLFHLFQCTAMLIPQKLYLLQVLRTVKARKRKQSLAEATSLAPTEQLAFSLEYRHQELDGSSSEQQVDFQAGSTHVVIYLDEENIPNGYCVDGVEW